MGTQQPDLVSTKLQRIAELARKFSAEPLLNVAHNIDVDWLRAAYAKVRKSSAPGVDGQTVQEYGRDLDENLRTLEDRFKKGLYRAPPVKRVYIPKGDGKEQRPIGLPTVEDKILQRAVAMVLEAIYEQVFLDCSYGFRRGRSPHNAIDALYRHLIDARGGWVIDVDIRRCFDELEHEQLRKILDLRVRDGVLRRAIGKWLNAGVLESGNISYPEAGTPQGGVISPMLMNIFLHTVLDEWFEEQVKPRVAGAELVRFADDFVIVCRRREDAERIMEVVGKRLGKHGLQLHPTKSRLVDFRRPDPKTGREPGTFNFLGFTFYWGTSRKGQRVIKQRTERGRKARFVKKVGVVLKRRRHAPVKAQHQYLCLAVNGHINYYGRTGNIRAIYSVVEQVRRLWHKWLSRRNPHRPMTWERFVKITSSLPLPRPRIVHSAYGSSVS